MNNMRVYYAHPRLLYGTEQEVKDLELLARLFPTHEIINPNQPEHIEQGKTKGLEYFLDLSKTCDILVFRAIGGGMITHGTFMELTVNWPKPRMELSESVPFDRYICEDDTNRLLKAEGKADLI
jgi:hypothetical protein